MSADLVPMALLTAAVALSWPEFIAMFRRDGRLAAIEVSLMSVATAVFLGAIGLGLQKLGVVSGGLVCLVGVLAGQQFRADAPAARVGTLFSAACFAMFLIGHHGST